MCVTAGPVLARDAGPVAAADFGVSRLCGYPVAEYTADPVGLVGGRAVDHAGSAVLPDPVVVCLVGVAGGPGRTAPADVAGGCAAGDDRSAGDAADRAVVHRTAGLVGVRVADPTAARSVGCADLVDAVGGYPVGRAVSTAGCLADAAVLGVADRGRIDPAGVSVHTAAGSAGRAAGSADDVAAPAGNSYTVPAGAGLALVHRTVGLGTPRSGAHVAGSEQRAARFDCALPAVVVGTGAVGHAVCVDSDRDCVDSFVSPSVGAYEGSKPSRVSVRPRDRYIFCFLYRRHD